MILMCYVGKTSLMTRYESMIILNVLLNSNLSIYDRIFYANDYDDILLAIPDEITNVHNICVRSLFITIMESFVMM